MFVVMHLKCMLNTSFFFIGTKLIKATDLHEDESYLISQIPQKHLQRCYFPLGDFCRDVLDKIVDATELKPLFSDKKYEKVCV